MGGALSSVAGYESQLHLTALLGNAEALKELSVRSGESSLFDLLTPHVDAKTADGTTALIITAAFDHVDSARVLLGKGADVNATDKFGSHALIHAASGGHAALLKLLLEVKGRRLELANVFDANALWSAAFTGQLECVELLLSAGASTGPSKKTKSTPLHAAAYTGRIEVVRALLRTGVSDVKDANGLTAFVLAETKGHVEIADLLRTHEREQAEAAVRAAEEAAAEAARRAANPRGMLGEMRRPLKPGTHTN